MEADSRIDFVKGRAIRPICTTKNDSGKTAELREDRSPYGAVLDAEIQRQGREGMYLLEISEKISM